MTLVVEDGSGVAGANTYNSVEDATAFFTARGFVAPTVGYESILLQTMDVLDGFLYCGEKTDASNAKPFPRKNCYDAEGVLYPDSVIPSALKQGQLWLAYYSSIGSSLGTVVTPAVKREKVDVLETEFAVNVGQSAQVTLRNLPNAFNLLSHLIKGKAGGSSGRVIRA